MVKGSKKSNTYRQVHKTTPGKRRVIHYKLKKPKKLACPICGIHLKGTLRLRPSQQSKYGKTEKRSERAYSNLCSKCARSKIIDRALTAKING